MNEGRNEIFSPLHFDDTFILQPNWKGKLNHKELEAKQNDGDDNFERNQNQR